jgi:hypothetical protein
VDLFVASVVQMHTRAFQDIKTFLNLVFSPSDPPPSLKGLLYSGVVSLYAIILCMKCIIYHHIIVNVKQYNFIALSFKFALLGTWTGFLEAADHVPDPQNPGLLHVFHKFLSNNEFSLRASNSQARDFWVYLSRIIP